MNDGNGAPPTDVTGLSAGDQRMAQIFALGVQAGFMSAMQQGFPVETVDDDGRAKTEHFTFPQMMYNLSLSMDNCAAMLDVNNQIAEEALEEQAPRSRPRRRGKR